MTTKYKSGQKVVGAKGAGTRTITKVSPTKISWTSGKRKGTCLISSFVGWQKGQNLAKNR